MSLTECIQPWK